MHFLSISLRALDDGFLQALKDELKHVHQASRDKLSALKAGVKAFGEDFASAQRQLAQVKEAESWSGEIRPRPTDIAARASAINRTVALCEVLERESNDLGKDLE